MWFPRTHSMTLIQIQALSWQWQLGNLGDKLWISLCILKNQGSMPHILVLGIFDTLLLVVFVEESWMYCTQLTHLAASSWVHLHFMVVCQICFLLHLLYRVPTVFVVSNPGTVFGIGRPSSWASSSGSEWCVACSQLPD